MMKTNAIVLAVLLVAACGEASNGASDAAMNADADAPATETITLVGKLEITGLPVHDVWGYTDESSGKDYALLSVSSAGLRVIDIEDRANPILVGSIEGNNVQSTDVKVWKNFAYIVGEGQNVIGNIIDLSDPTSPTAAGTFPSAHNIAISDDGYMFLAAPGLRIYDLNADPSNPVEVYSDNDCRGHDIAVVGNRLYDFADDCGTRIFDIADPANPDLLGTVVDPAFFHHSGWPSSDGNFLLVCDEIAGPSQPDIAVWDIRDLSAPVRVDSYSDPDSYVHNLYVVGDYAYVSYYRAGFRVFDISDPTQIVVSDEFDTDPSMSGPGFGGNFGVYPFLEGGGILASDESSGLFVFSFDGKR